MRTAGLFTAARPAKASIPLSDISLLEAVIWLIEYILELLALLFSISFDTSTARK